MFACGLYTLVVMTYCSTTIYNSSLVDCYFENYIFHSVDSTISTGECGLKCFTTSDCAAFATKGPDCGLLLKCPKCCSYVDILAGDTGWRVYCQSGQFLGTPVVFQLISTLYYLTL